MLDQLLLDKLTAVEARYEELSAMLAEPAPYVTSRAYGLDAVPTTVAIGAGGESISTSTAWGAANAVG